MVAIGVDRCVCVAVQDNGGQSAMLLGDRQRIERRHHLVAISKPLIVQDTMEIDHAARSASRDQRGVEGLVTFVQFAGDRARIPGHPLKEADQPM